jgi:hypothetical protein
MVHRVVAGHLVEQSDLDLAAEISLPPIEFVPRIVSKSIEPSLIREASSCRWCRR